MSEQTDSASGANRRSEILAVARKIVREEGAAALTQPRLARYMGLRQSHITYYFPRKADLFAALLAESHEQMGARAEQALGDCFELLVRITFDAESMRFYLSMLLASASSPDLRAAILAHTQVIEADLAVWLGRRPGDRSVSAFVDELLGLGVRALVEPDLAMPDVQAMSARHGLEWPR
ncbi:TetR/AcrR family transcriptional regulator [Devosia sp. XJ19-1]|uniref:TetR/AcrR family transcriptional regulator n=1 Tax=Devosia ureilytica TaxID=2952754 RepID=UPI0020C784E5|nr:TetR/AcrR family transcriptional regulator [Devosia ureilytica]MCP8885405.1 TetR/AcrR family transcriptional regulator [Devosia ureilytica]